MWRRAGAQGPHTQIRSDHTLENKAASPQVSNSHLLSISMIEKYGWSIDVVMVGP